MPSNTFVDSMIRSSVVTVEAAGLRERRGRLLGALERRGDEVGDVAVADALRHPLGHLRAAVESR